MNIQVCTNIGVSGTTPCCIKKENGIFEARMGISLLGTTNMSEAEFKRAENNPFHEKFYDNYCSGKGDTEKEAIDRLRENLKELTASLFIE